MFYPSVAAEDSALKLNDGLRTNPPPLRLWVRYFSDLRRFLTSDVILPALLLARRMEELID